MAERVMSELTRHGMGRQTAYKLVRSCTIEANQTRKELKEIISDNEEIRKYLSLEEIGEIMDSTYLSRFCY